MGVDAHADSIVGSREVGHRSDVDYGLEGAIRQSNAIEHGPTDKVRDQTLSVKTLCAMAKTAQ